MALKVFNDYERKYYLGKQFVPWLKPRNDKKENEVEKLPPHLTKSPFFLFTCNKTFAWTLAISTLSIGVRLLEEVNDMKIKQPAPFTFEAGPRAVLLLHGFTGNSADVRMLGRYLESKGYSSHAPIYRGHG